MLLSDLTPELILCILECCHASQIVAIQSLNHSWQSFVNQHEGSIFRRCAVLHGFSRESDSLDAAKARDYGSDWLGDVSSWRNFCKENLLLASRWRFESVPANARLPMRHHGFAHRAKIDEDDGLLLYTSSTGGLDVRDSKTLEPLGQFPRRAVRAFAHLEYGGGFAIFDRVFNSHEVWVKRSVSHNYTEHRCPESVQEEVQINFARPSAEYIPYSVLHNPTPTRAYRFIFPELLVGSEDTNTAHIWDVIRGTVVEAYSLKQGIGPLIEEDTIWGAMSYVELSRDHIFVSFTAKLVVYARNTRAFAESTPSSLLTGPPWREAVPVLVLPRDFHASSRAQRFVSRCDLRSLVRMGEYATVTPMTSTEPPPAIEYLVAFPAVHVSPDGKNFVAVDEDGIIYYVRNFAVSESEGRAIWALDTESVIGNLAWDGDKFAFSTDNGVFLVHINHDQSSDDETFPAKWNRVFLVNPIVSIGVSSLQMTKTALWYCCYPPFDRPLAPENEPALFQVDFANGSVQ